MLHVYVCMAHTTRQIISAQYHIWKTNISVRFLRCSGMLRSYVGSSLPMFRDSLPVPYSRVRHCSWTELPEWVFPKHKKTSETGCCVTTHNSEGRNHTAAQVSNSYKLFSYDKYVYIWNMYRCTVSIVGVVRLLYGQPRNSRSMPYRAKRFLHHRKGTSQLWKTHTRYFCDYCGLFVRG